VVDISDIPEEIIDRATFDQILEMDDDDERDFSKTIVFGFFEQAEDTFKQMENFVYVYHNSLWQLYSHIY
jgi:osomolarity two-component system phosphorelay intermediate protein YPD1